MGNDTEGKRMNFDEAVTAMKEGKKVRISSWKRDAYIILLDDEFFTPNDCIRELSYSQITATNWEVVEPEPKDEHEWIASDFRKTGSYMKCANCGKSKSVVYRGNEFKCEPTTVPLSEKERDADCCDEDAPIFQKKDVKEVLKNTVKELRICNNAMDIKTFVEIIFEKHFGSDLL